MYHQNPTVSECSYNYKSEIRRVQVFTTGKTVCTSIDMSAGCIMSTIVQLRLVGVLSIGTPEYFDLSEDVTNAFQSISYPNSLQNIYSYAIH